jgi:hypothetical protein
VLIIRIQETGVESVITIRIGAMLDDDNIDGIFRRDEVPSLRKLSESRVPIRESIG